MCTDMYLNYYYSKTNSRVFVRMERMAIICTAFHILLPSQCIILYALFFLLYHFISMLLSNGYLLIFSYLLMNNSHHVNLDCLFGTQIYSSSVESRMFIKFKYPLCPIGKMVAPEFNVIQRSYDVI